MRKFLISAAVAVIAAGVGYLGLQFHVQRSIAAEIDGALARLSAGGITVTRGSVNFDLASRTLVMTDIVLASDAQPSLDVKIGRLTATGVDVTQTARFAADRIEIADAEAGGTLPMPGGPKLVYKAPRITVARYSGPAAPLHDLSPTSSLDLWRYALEHFAAISADSIEIPSITASLTPSDPNATKGLGPVTYIYSDIALRDLRDGKTASATIARFSFTGKIAGAGAADEQMTGEIANLAMLDVDTSASLAILDPAQAKDDTYHRAYRRVSAGPYTVSIGSAVKFRIDSLTVDDLGLRPAKLQIGELLSIINTMPVSGPPPSTAQMQQLLQKVGDIYEGIGIGQFELKGISVTVPDNTIKLGTARLNRLQNGRIAEFAIDDLDIGGSTPSRIGHFALKALDIAGMIHFASRFAPGGSQPSPQQVVAMLPLLGGVELKGFTTTPADGKRIDVDAASMSWGGYVGPLPSRLRVSLKMSGPVDDQDRDPFKMLVAAGFTRASIGLDLGLDWNESTGTLMLAPGAVELGNVGALSAKASVANVAPWMFSADPLDLMITAALVEAGPVEVVLSDTGGLDLAIAQYARQQNVTRDAARQAILANIRQSAAAMAALSPDVAAVADAIAHFVETAKGTLTIKLTPKGSVPLQTLIDTTKTNPMEALSHFKIEAKAGK